MEYGAGVEQLSDHRVIVFGGFFGENFASRCNSPASPSELILDGDRDPLQLARFTAAVSSLGSFGRFHRGVEMAECHRIDGGILRLKSGYLRAQDDDRR